MNWLTITIDDLKAVVPSETIDTAQTLVTPGQTDPVAVAIADAVAAVRAAVASGNALDTDPGTVPRSLRALTARQAAFALLERQGTALTPDQRTTRAADAAWMARIREERQRLPRQTHPVPASMPPARRRPASRPWRPSRGETPATRERNCGVSETVGGEKKTRQRSAVPTATTAFAARSISNETMKIFIDEFCLTNGGEESPTGLSINGQQRVQSVASLRGSVADVYPRGNRVNTVTFAITRTHASPGAAEGFLFFHAATLPASGGLTFLCEDAEGAAVRYTAADAAVAADKGTRAGLATTHQYTVVCGTISGGELPEK